MKQLLGFQNNQNCVHLLSCVNIKGSYSFIDFDPFANLEKFT